MPPQAQGGRPEVALRLVLLNRVSDESKANPKASTPLALSENWPAAPSHNSGRRHSSANGRGDRNVLVVVRRRGPPYDTKILHGRIRGGQLTVDARGWLCGDPVFCTARASQPKGVSVKALLPCFPLIYGSMV